MSGKLTSLSDAVTRLVCDGDRISAACGLEARIPFAAGHEIIRQGKRDLTLVGPISDALYDQLIGAGCARAVEAAWIGNVGTGLGHNFRRAVERGEPHPLAVVDYTNFTLALGLRAAGEGVPFAVTCSISGTGFAAQTHAFRPIDDPFGGEPLIAVKAIPLDVAIVHVQRADPSGNAHVFGNLGTTLESVRAARRCIVTAEEIVEPAVLREQPNATVVPGFLVDAVVHEPGGAHPSPVLGKHERDHAFFAAYADASRTAEGWRAWRAQWIDGVSDRAAYVARLAETR
ncbi:MAG: CoA transferase subunit A [Candidatus Velthaea sp.]